ncbi:transcription elongation factor SPT4 homolog 2-like [Selaginella moellendorffii]|uniref:transcription elongation factor SPT4 homolog 2-like n=1 Tax=Selaginella moellendorffii TaxID=88036 RepID=UPI000D1C2853|nr:transcription elongation factor SPT4 homolog 2-like [Selaginella moellendorffii]|eukprot:XP_024518101.1 transcription elongation factor SPT4 homolog 2-like [Selaginella moellendorffii]
MGATSRSILPVAQLPLSLSAGLPSGKKSSYVACLGCHLVKSQLQFATDGCENCGNFFGSVEESTTSLFTGVVSIMDSSQSWVAKWMRIERLLPGCYAITVEAPAAGEA